MDGDVQEGGFVVVIVIGFVIVYCLILSPSGPSIDGHRVPGVHGARGGAVVGRAQVSLSNWKFEKKKKNESAHDYDYEMSEPGNELR